MRLLLLGLALLVTVRPAAAGPDEPGLDLKREAMIESGLTKPGPSALDSVPHPWPGIALLLSAVGTAAPILVASSVAKTQSDAGITLGILATEVVTPSAGHVYAGLWRRAGVGMIWRGVGYGLLLTGAGMQGLFPAQTESSDFGWGIPVMILGTTVMAGSALTDVITVPGDVDRRNAEWLRQHAATGIRLNREGQPELCLSVRF